MKKNKNEKFPLRVVELFAGVGGFRIGLEACNNGSTPYFSVVWSNQWEPTTKKQHASDIYVARFGEEGHSNEDISKLNTNDIPQHDLLVGGFPCQDYSVARTLNQAEGLVGQKGVLWWEIHRILEQKVEKPSYLLLENVDRLLKSPAGQRGRDFTIMLASLSDLGYAVEWRVINAADYGMPQRRRRVFFLGYHKSTDIYKRIEELHDRNDWIIEDGLLAKAFPVDKAGQSSMFSSHIDGDLADITERFNKQRPRKTSFENAGVMIGRNFYTVNVKPHYSGKRTVMKDVLIPDKKVPEEYFIEDSELNKWRFLKGAKDLKRKSKRTGHEYSYNEGPMAFPEPLDKPSRTIVTGEGGSTPSRFKHVVITKDGRFRRLTPVELERLNMFPDNHTEGVTDTKRAFLMGNALVVGAIEKVGKQLIEEILLV